MTTENKKCKFLAIGLGIFFILAGTPKAIGLAPAIAKFASWGLPVWFMHFVGIAEWAGGIGLIVCKTRLPAAFAMTLVMVGATVTQICNGEYLVAIAPIIVGGLCLLVVKSECGSCETPTQQK